MPDSVVQKPYVKHVGTISNLELEDADDKLKLTIILKTSEEEEKELIVRQQSILEGYGAIASILAMTKEASKLGETVIVVSKTEGLESLVQKIGVIKK
jgi:predicted class III extradiol MEMO1 family dioxygenase